MMRGISVFSMWGALTLRVFLVLASAIPRVARVGEGGQIVQGGEKFQGGFISFSAILPYNAGKS